MEPVGISWSLFRWSENQISRRRNAAILPFEDPAYHPSAGLAPMQPNHSIILPDMESDANSMPFGRRCS